MQPQRHLSSSHMPTSPLFIDDPDGLAAFCDSLQGESLLAVDTEFIRELSYLPVLELVQLADANGRTALVDYRTVGAAARRPLARILADPGILKVFHDAHADLELLQTAVGEQPAPIWDTQLAAGFFGYDGPNGYAGMVRALLGHGTPDGRVPTGPAGRSRPPSLLMPPPMSNSSFRSTGCSASDWRNSAG
jgi:ribonuclease D